MFFAPFLYQDKKVYLYQDKKVNKRGWIFIFW